MCFIGWDWHNPRVWCGIWMMLSHILLRAQSHSSTAACAHTHSDLPARLKGLFFFQRCGWQTGQESMPVYPLLLERATYLQHHQRILKIHRKIQEYTRNIEGNSFVELEGSSYTVCFWSGFKGSNLWLSTLRWKKPFYVHIYLTVNRLVITPGHDHMSPDTALCPLG